MDFIIALAMYVAEGFIQYPVSTTLFGVALYFNLKHI